MRRRRPLRSSVASTLGDDVEAIDTAAELADYGPPATRGSARLGKVAKRDNQQVKTAALDGLASMAAGARDTILDVEPYEDWPGDGRVGGAAHAAHWGAAATSPWNRAEGMMPSQ